MITDADGKASEASDVTVGIANPTAAITHVWTGAVDDQWSIAGNWDTNLIPDANDVVVFRDQDAGGIDLEGSVVEVGDVHFDGAGSFDLHNASI